LRPDVLTELDNCILGIVWREGPMSAYGVRSHLARSTTPTWSSSTGTVYPAIRRLREAGLLAAESPTGPRKSELLSVTAEGVKALSAWLTATTAEIGAPTADPIRTRVHFLGALPKASQREMLEAYKDATRAAVEELDQHARAVPTNKVEASEQLGTLGALAELRARLQWLDEVERLLGL
jgi:DNA-binding PadR family transcriptional regulator